MKCYISSSCSSKESLPGIVHELAGLGFRNIELTGNVKYGERLEETALSLKDRYDVDFIIHNYLPFQPADFVLNLASTNIGIKIKTLDLIHHAVELSQKLGKDLYSLHPGFTYDLRPEQSDDFFIKASERLNDKKNFHHALSGIARFLGPDCFRIAVENLAPKNPDELYSFLCAPEDIFDFLGHFKDTPNVGLLLDLGHLNVAAASLHFDKDKTLDEIFREYAEKIYALHISENDGSKDHHRVSDLDSWQLKFLQDNKERLKGKPVVFEWHNSASEETFKRFEIIRSSLE